MRSAEFGIKGGAHSAHLKKEDGSVSPSNAYFDMFAKANKSGAENAGKGVNGNMHSFLYFVIGYCIILLYYKVLFISLHLEV